MNEITKTLAFVAAAAVILVATVFSRPRLEIDKVSGDAGAEFYAEYTDPLKVASFEITDFDEDQAAIRPFKAAVVDGLWSIPSHQNYPADANRQLAVATTSLIGLQKLEVVSTVKGDHEVYGVIDPSDTKNLSVGAKGVGKHVKLTDGGDNVLVDLIIGKEDPNRSGIRFVRLPGRDEVYATKVDVSKLTTKFHEWIETDLLKLNALDVKQVTVKDYTVDELRGAISFRGEFKTSFDSKDSKWTLDEMKQAGKQGFEEVKLGPDQELDTGKLNDLKNALDDLKIVDVERKPKGLAADLAVSDDLKADREKLQNLMQRGFFPAQIKGADNKPRLELFSNDGEVICAMNDGVEYVLRFGQIAGQSREEQDKDKKDDEKKEGEKKEQDSGVDRFIMVSARFNPDLIAKPALKPVPGETQPQPPKAEEKKEEPKKEETKKPEPPNDAGAKPAEPAKTETPKAEPAKTEPTKTEAPKSEAPKTDAKPAENKPAEKKEGGSGAFNVVDDPVKDAEKKADAKAEPAKAEPAKTEEKKEAPKPEPAKSETPKSEPVKTEPAKTEPAKAADPAADAKAAEDKKKQEEEERKRIVDENKRLQDEYDGKLAAGKKQADDLNHRFSAWYYIINDSVYKKIHLNTKDVIKTKEVAKPDGDTKKDESKNDPIGKFNDLKEKGLDK